MPISINRAAGRVPQMTRDTVPVNALFRYLDKTSGKPKGSTFANVGYVPSQGKYYSVAVDGDKRGDLSSNANGTRAVAIVGNFKFEAKMLPTSKFVTTSRADLEPGDVFQVPQPKAERAGKRPALYIALGFTANDTKVMSWNLNTRDIALGTKLNGTVRKVGDINIDTKIAA